VTALESSEKSAPTVAFAVQGYCGRCEHEKLAYGGRFFAPVTDSATIDGANAEWERRKSGDLSSFWPRSAIPFGHMTHQRQPLPQHGYLRWSDMFNARQLLLHAQLLEATTTAGEHAWKVRECALAAYQQYLRNQNMFSFWNIQADKLEPMLSNANFHPKAQAIENAVFSRYGRGNWQSCVKSLSSSIDWARAPWEPVSNARLGQRLPSIAGALRGKSSKVQPHDPVQDDETLACRSATDLSTVEDGSHDLVVTDPPFGGLLHYSELSDFFYVWLRLVLNARYPSIFKGEYTPKTLEAVANRAREPEDPDGYYQRLLTAAWREAHRILKPGGILAFTFHHSEDAPWVAVLESLFDAGFYLEATYPIRSDEIKGAGEFGSKKIEYDIIHVCRKRRGEPSAVSWAKMRREVLRDVRRLKSLLEHHKEEGLPNADLQVIRRGKALEYYSRHYGKVLVDDEEPMSVKDALLGINQLLDEESGQVTKPPPSTAAPFTRQFLRLFDGQMVLKQDQMQKFLRGTGYAPSDFVSRGWCTHDRKAKEYEVVPAIEIARGWHGKHRQGMVQDYDQAAFLIGACIEGSGINASETLNNDRFKPHAALGALLQWFASHGANSETRIAASRADRLLRGWRERNRAKAQQMSLFFGDGEAD